MSELEEIPKNDCQRGKLYWKLWVNRKQEPFTLIASEGRKQVGKPTSEIYIKSKKYMRNILSQKNIFQIYQAKSGWI